MHCFSWLRLTVGLSKPNDLDLTPRVKQLQRAAAQTNTFKQDWEIFLPFSAEQIDVENGELILNCSKLTKLSQAANVIIADSATRKDMKMAKSFWIKK